MDRPFMDWRKAIICQDRLLIEVKDKDELTAGGIYLSDGSREERFVGVVLKRGSDYSGGAKVGDEVLAGKSALRSFECKREFGEGIHILNMKDVMAIVPKEKAK